MTKYQIKERKKPKEKQIINDISRSLRSARLEDYIFNVEPLERKKKNIIADGISSSLLQFERHFICCD